MKSTKKTSKELSSVAYQEAPLTALSRETLRKLSSLLNTLKIIHSDDGYERDWRGLATLSEQRNFYNEKSFADNDPSKRVIELWCENQPSNATFGNLVKYLGLIDRWHVIEDLEENFLQDLQSYQTPKEQPAASTKSLNTENKVLELSCVTNQELSINTIQNNLTTNNNRENIPYESESKILTSNDVQRYQQGLPLQTYDAFVLYADADYEYALEILLKLQNNPLYNFKFCLKDDLLFGIPFEHIALMELIRERCKFLIAILTREFTKSPENRFFVNYAQALQIKQEIRKVIPLLYEDQVDIPANLAMFSRMHYKPKRTDLFWSKLADSMQLIQLSEGVTTFSATFQRSLVTKRPQHRNLAIEAENNHPELEAVTSSNSNNRIKRKSRFYKKGNRAKLKASSLKTLNEFGNDSQGSKASNLDESRGIFRKLFCCRQ